MWAVHRYAGSPDWLELRLVLVDGGSLGARPKLGRRAEEEAGAEGASFVLRRPAGADWLLSAEGGERGRRWLAERGLELRLLVAAAAADLEPPQTSPTSGKRAANWSQISAVTSDSERTLARKPARRMEIPDCAIDHLGARRHSAESCAGRCSDSLGSDGADSGPAEGAGRGPATPGPLAGSRPAPTGPAALVLRLVVEKHATVASAERDATAPPVHQPRPHHSAQSDGSAPDQMAADESSDNRANLRSDHRHWMQQSAQQQQQQQQQRLQQRHQQPLRRELAVIAIDRLNRFVRLKPDLKELISVDFACQGFCGGPLVARAAGGAEPAGCRCRLSLAYRLEPIEKPAARLEVARRLAQLRAAWWSLRPAPSPSAPPQGRAKRLLRLQLQLHFASMNLRPDNLWVRYRLLEALPAASGPAGKPPVSQPLLEGATLASRPDVRGRFHFGCLEELTLEVGAGRQARRLGKLSAMTRQSASPLASNRQQRSFEPPETSGKLDAATTATATATTTTTTTTSVRAPGWPDDEPEQPSCDRSPTDNGGRAASSIDRHRRLIVETSDCNSAGNTKSSAKTNANTSDADALDDTTRSGPAAGAKEVAENSRSRSQPVCTLVLLFELFTSDFYRDKAQGWAQLTLAVDLGRPPGARNVRHELPIVQLQLNSALDRLRHHLIGRLPDSAPPFECFSQSNQRYLRQTRQGGRLVLDCELSHQFSPDNANWLGADPLARRQQAPRPTPTGIINQQRRGADDSGDLDTRQVVEAYKRAKNRIEQLDVSSFLQKKPPTAALL